LAFFTPHSRIPSIAFYGRTILAGTPVALPDSYTLKPNSIPAYFDAMLDAQPPERFSIKFLENLGFTSTNDRLFVGILKDLGFLNRDGAPQARYFNFIDRSQSKHVVAEGVREAFSDLFAINTKADDFTVDEARNKLHTLYAGKKTDLVIGNIAKTFRALCDYADFTGTTISRSAPVLESSIVEPKPNNNVDTNQEEKPAASGKIRVSAMQYHINIVLPDTRDQAVYDAIFKSLRDHLG
jgi:hypothetical protein